MRQRDTQEYTVTAYIDELALPGLVVPYALFCTEPTYRDDARALQQTAYVIGDLRARMDNADGPVDFRDESWRDFFCSWPRAILRGSGCAALPDAVTGGLPVLIIPLLDDCSLAEHSGRNMTQHDSHLASAIVTDCGNIKKLRLRLVHYET